MQCKTCRKMLPRYLENKSGYPEVIEHLAHCSACASIVRHIQDVEVFFGHDRDMDADPFLFTRVLAAVEKSAARERFGFWHRVKLQPYLVGIAFILLVWAGIQLGKVYSYRLNLSDDYRNEIYYLSDVHQESLESFLLSE